MSNQRVQSICMDNETIAIKQVMKEKGINFSFFVRTAMKKLAANDYVQADDSIDASTQAQILEKLEVISKAVVKPRSAI